MMTPRSAIHCTPMASVMVRTAEITRLAAAPVGRHIMQPTPFKAVSAFFFCSSVKVA